MEMCAEVGGPGLILSALISCRGIRPHAGCPERGDGSWVGGWVGGGLGHVHLFAVGNDKKL